MQRCAGDECGAVQDKGASEEITTYARMRSDNLAQDEKATQEHAWHDGADHDGADHVSAVSKPFPLGSNKAQH